MCRKPVRSGEPSPCAPARARSLDTAIGAAAATSYPHSGMTRRPRMSKASPVGSVNRRHVPQRELARQHRHRSCRDFPRFGMRLRAGSSTSVVRSARQHRRKSVELARSEDVAIVPQRVHRHRKIGAAATFWNALSRPPVAPPEPCGRQRLHRRLCGELVG